MNAIDTAKVAATLATLAAALSDLAAALAGTVPSAGGDATPTEPPKNKGGRPRKNTEAAPAAAAQTAPAAAPAPTAAPSAPAPTAAPSAPASSPAAPAVADGVPSAEALQAKAVELVTAGIAPVAIKAAIDPNGRRVAELSPAERIGAMGRLIALAQPAPAPTPAQDSGF